MRFFMKDYEISNEYLFSELKGNLMYDRECFHYFINELQKAFPNESFKYSLSEVGPKSVYVNSEIYKSVDFQTIVKDVVSEYTWDKPFEAYSDCGSVFREVCWRCALEIVMNCQLDTINLNEKFVVKVIR